MSKINNLKSLPSFNTEDQERDFWAQVDTSEYFDFSQAKRVAFPNLKLTRELISIRLSKSLLTRIKLIANKKDVPYQSLIKSYLDRAVEKDSRLLH